VARLSPVAAIHRWFETPVSAPPWSCSGALNSTDALISAGAVPIGVGSCSSSSHNVRFVDTSGPIPPPKLDSVGFSIGIVGLPNVGKSTLFNALTTAAVAAENYPFTTIEPNRGVAVVDDPRLGEIAAIFGSPKTHPATIEFVDIAGLVEGASHGEGLGNQFLHHIRETDAIAHIVRCFEDPNVAHVAGTIDPATDLGVVETELLIADLEAVRRAEDKIGRQARAGDRHAAARLETLQHLDDHLAGGAPARTFGTPIEDLFLLTSKPTLYVVNVDESGVSTSQCAEAVRQHAAATGAGVVVVPARLEVDLASFDEDDRAELLADYGGTESGLVALIEAAHRLLDLRTFFTANESEARAWTVPVGTRAPAAAGAIHSDFERGFVRAEVVSYDDLVETGSEHAAKESGRWRTEGRDYEVQEGDVIRFRFNV
jgi:ribosome-binding ATPase